jgi:hypothetical protein
MDHLTLAYLAKDAYLEPKEFEKKWGDKYVIHYIETEEGLECYALHDGENLVISFRGTEDAQDILQDLRAIILQKFVWGRAHKGFAVSVESAWDKLLEVVKGAGDVHMFITGHSKGGAEATYFASKLQALILSGDHDNPIEGHIDDVVTFGSPRVLGLKAAWVYRATLGNKTYRYVHVSDPVTLLPFSFRYAHVKQLRWFTGKRWRKKIGIFGRFIWLYHSIKAIPTILKDGGSHPMSNYVEDQEKHPFPK